VDDAALHTALSKIGKVRNRPVTAVLMAFDGEAAAAWAALPWSVAAVEGDADVAKVIIDRLEGTLAVCPMSARQEDTSPQGDIAHQTNNSPRVEPRLFRLQ